MRRDEQRLHDINVLVHEYFGIYWPLVWQTAADHAPVLRGKIAEILKTEFFE